ncbi:LOW QUALITY PROTEIN: UNC93-like protein [Penaeus monodon]|uniref:LOW QUALITY PROTEIN: UNC93-like protein n=1 Tax=Penaeus monodon TaxID=6687 RepID=UPI0018A78B49|nr:LOW QUALITY PROTEIN: UNC93-like protein [Penaeus monodon]
MFLFTSYNSMSFLQSSINKVEGTASLTVLYAAFIFSCCFLPSWMIRRLDEKYTMAACMLCYSTYMAAQFYPRIYRSHGGGGRLGARHVVRQVTYPSIKIYRVPLPPVYFVNVWFKRHEACLSVTPPFVSANDAVFTVIHWLWSEKLVKFLLPGSVFCVTVMLRSWLNIKASESEVVITVWGNVISSTVLSVGVEKNKTAEELLTCGYNFCLDQQYEESPSNATVSTDSREDGPALWKIYTMASIYLACALLAAVITVFFVDPLSRFLKESPASQEKSGLVLVAATFNQLRHPYQLLIIPLTIWSGVEQAFLGADYTAAFVSCGLGVHMVGYVTICYGVCDAICSVGFSPIVRKYGRVPVFSLGFLINLGLNITLTYWTPKTDDLVVFFVISGLWGVADAVWQTQINTLYGVIFPGESEAAFSNYRLWESTGFIIAYACSTVLCVSSKIVVLNVFLLLGIVGYYAIEVLEKRGGLEKDKDGKVVVLDRLLLRLLKKRASV